jgi:hypothetical protein
MYDIARRKALIFGLFGWAAMLEGCGGKDPNAPESVAAASPSPAPGPGPAATPRPPPPAPSPSPPAAPPPPPATVAWDVGAINFTVGSGATKDLAATLPTGVAKGGTFGVSASGAALPVGMTLSATGILAISTAPVGPVIGVIFTYAEPAL